MTLETIAYSQETDVPVNFIGSMLDFVYQKYLTPQPERFTNVFRTTEQGESLLAFTVLDGTRKRIFRIEIKGSKPLKVRITPLDEVTQDAVEDVKEDIVIAVELFEERVRQNTLFFAWREGESIVPEAVSGKENKSLRRILLETQILLMVLFTAVGLFLFLIIPTLLVPIILLALQFVIVFYSSKLIARSADWHITENNTDIHLLEYHLPLEEQEAFKKKYPKEKIKEIKREVYEQTIAKKGEVDCNATREIFVKNGIECNPESFTSKKVNVYEIVNKARKIFGFPMPEIVVSNTLLPNAAASGPSPSRGVVLLTTGLLTQLDENEILSVLGHEFGHLKGRDPLLLFGLSAAQYLLWFYVILGLFPFGSLFLFFIYFWAIMTLIYFVAKFFEARADLISAIMVGQPLTLAESLEKIGFKRLLFERLPSYRIQEWISFDAHPPIYFRINRLRKLKDADKIKHPLYQSAKDVTKGFVDSL